MTLDLINLLSGLAVGAGTAFAVMYFRHEGATKNLQLMENHLKEDIAELKTELADSKTDHITEVENLKEEHAARLKEIREENWVVVYPYEVEEGDDGLFTDDRYFEAGYQFQLFIKGAPCLAPAKVAIKTLKKSEVSFAKIKAIKKEVLDFLDTTSKDNPFVRLPKESSKPRLPEVEYD